MNNDIEKFLYQFIELPQDIISDFEEIMTFTEIEPFDFFIKTNEYPTDFFVVKTGLIRSYLETEAGKEVTRYFFTPGQIATNLSSLIQQKSSNLNYQALTKVTGYSGNYKKFKELTLKHHKISMLYVKLMQDSYLKAEKVILDISSKTTTERYLDLQKKIPGIDNIIAQHYIASYLNVSPVQLSRIRKSLLNK